MQASRTERGFRAVVHPEYPNGEESRILQESSAIGGYEDSWDKPGSSFLWVGNDFHLNREEVAELIARMQHWLDTGSLHNEE